MIPDLVPSSLLAPMGRQEGKPFPAEEDWEDLRMGEGTVPTVGSWGQPTTCPFQEDTISINHNWVNGCNLANMWHFLQQELCAVQQEVSEWRDTMPDWHHHCQVIMRSCSGINFEEFYHFLKVIAERRLLLAKKIGSGDVECYEGSGLGPQQIIFDIGRIAEVLASVVVNPDFQRVDTSIFSPQPEDLLQQLEEIVAATESL